MNSVDAVMKGFTVRIMNPATWHVARRRTSSGDQR
jgi:hypothetical protein